MSFKYIKKDSKYIRENLYSILIYFDHFSPGIRLPKIIDNSLNRRIIHFLARILVILMFVSKAYLLKYERIELDEDLLILISGKDNWGSRIKLVKEYDNLKIVKEIRRKEIYLHEKTFYQCYSDSSDKIILPKSRFLGRRNIETEFIPQKSLERLMNEGIINLNEAMDLAKTIKSELNKMYKNNKLIHGDLEIANIFPTSNFIYIIDYSDSHIFDPQLDYLVLIRSILLNYHMIDSNYESFLEYLKNNPSISKSFNLNKKTMSQVMEHLALFRNKKHGFAKV